MQLYSAVISWSAWRWFICHSLLPSLRTWLVTIESLSWHGSSWSNLIKNSWHLFLKALETSLPCSFNVLSVMIKIDLKSWWAWTVLSFSPATRPYSLIERDWLPSSRRELSLSKIDGLHRFAFSKIAQPPLSIIETNTESIHSNRLAPFLNALIF